MGTGDLDWQSVALRRTGGWADRPVHFRHEVDSTNTLAAQLVPDQAPPGAVIVAEYQHAGRGRLARRWVADPFSALTFTVVLGPLVPAWAAPMVCGLATLEALAQFGIAAALKWPNDVLVGGRKCAGILIESRPVAGAVWLLAGIGINVRSVDPALEDATYLDAHLTTPIRREDLLVALLDRLEHWCAQAGADSAAVRLAWQARLSTLGQMVTVQTPTGPFDGLASGVAPDGGLVVQLADGTSRIVQAGDVTLSGKRTG